MASLLIIRDYEKAAAATSFDELWRSLSNDELFELRWLLERATGRSLTPSFNGATQDDWTAMRRVLRHLERLVRRVNALLDGADWSDAELVASLLTRAEAEDQSVDEDSEYLAVAHELYAQLRIDALCGGGGVTFRDRGVFALKNVPIMPQLDDRSYDIFISYKTARHADDAQRLADRLIASGYGVWFDKYVLNRLKDRPETFETEHLLAILKHAVSQSACTIIFEGALSAAALGPGDTGEALVAKRQLMSVNNALVIWDWHGIEIMATKWGIAIHPHTITAFHQEGGKVTWSKAHTYHTDSQREGAIDAALRAVADAKATQGTK